MCYELEGFRWKRATEAERKRAQLKTTTERTPVNRPLEPVQLDPAPQKELEPV